MFDKVIDRCTKRKREKRIWRSSWQRKGRQQQQHRFLCRHRCCRSGTGSSLSVVLVLVLLVGGGAEIMSAYCRQKNQSLVNVEQQQQQQQKQQRVGIIKMSSNVNKDTWQK
ncbi:hypothetical protein M0804_000472 [Polistes exclamans]|nr:hypothetical protein M0804_000472 [Polistes exclamans]